MLSQVYQLGLHPLLLRLDPEAAHAVAIAGCRTIAGSPWLQSLTRQRCAYSHPSLAQTVWGLSFPNPLGLAAGFDKNAEATTAWESFGFGFAEVGSITAHAQPGNPQPRLFRLRGDRAILNRMGFNNLGADAIAEHLRDRPASPGIPLGINLGKSKITPLGEAAGDYLRSFEVLEPYGDYFVVNVSSPNTPGLRSLQSTTQLQEILVALQQANHHNKPLLVKITPDLADGDIAEIAALAIELGLAGIIATNTTIAREGLTTQVLAETGKSVREEVGGISGKPLRARSLQVIRLLRRETQGRLPIVGVGGIFAADDAWEAITAGASLLQLYTGWIYEGPFVVRRILEGLVQKLEAHGLDNISQAIGLDSR